jgi:predicted nucleic acid-binding protein
MAGKIIIFDTSIFIEHLRTNKYIDHFQNVTGLVRNSAVVMSELLRGATRRAELDFVSTLVKNHPILTPTERNWIESGEILSKIYKDRGFSPEKLRDLHFDVLIALTARNHGAILITSNKTDFELIKTYKDFYLEVW